MTFGSLFSGVGGFDLGFEQAGLECVWQVEKDEQCNQVLQRHWPTVERRGDVNEFSATIIPDVICGGFPCQDLSVAGKRAGLAGERSGLFHQFMRIVGEVSPRWVVIENVPGLLSSNEGRDMGIVLESLAELRYGFAYRILDAQWFGVPQRRRRVFIVGCLGDWRSAAKILFEPESLPWDSAPRVEARARIAAAITSGSTTGSGVNRPGRRREDDVNLVARTVTTREGQRMGCDRDTYITHTLRAEGFDASEDGTGRGTPLTVAIPLDMRQLSRGEKMTNNRADGGAPGTGIGSDGDPSPCIAESHPPAIAFAQNQRGEVRTSAVAPQLTCGGGKPGEGYSAVAYRTSGNCGVMEQGDRTAALNCATDPNQNIIVGGFKRGQGYKARSDGYQVEQAPTLTSSDSGTQQRPGVHIGMAVRRLTPTECERLQGFPDDHTRWDAGGKELSDSARYRMLGNAVAVPVAEWIGRRLMEANS